MIKKLLKQIFLYIGKFIFMAVISPIILMNTITAILLTLNYWSLGKIKDDNENK